MKKDDSYLTTIVNYLMIMHKKSKLCKHNHGCIENSIAGFLSTYKWSFLIKITSYYLFGIRKILKI
jgi:hypothetical protein